MSAISTNLIFDRVVNTTHRSEFQNKPFWYRFTHPVEKLIVDNELYTEILSYFDHTFRIHDLEHTARIWEFVLKSRSIHWVKEDELTIEKFDQIQQAFRDAFVYSGPGIDFTFDGNEDIDAITKYLFVKEEKIPTSFFRWENFKKIAFSADVTHFEEFRAKLQEALEKGYEVFKMGATNEQVFKGFVFNIVALLAYSYPTEGVTITIPVKRNGHWDMAVYRVDKKFEMSPAWFSSPLPAYGLVSDSAPPILSCLGTTFGEGLVATVLSDFTPGFSVGHGASLYGKKEIEQWLEGKKLVIVAGISLGGAISLHISRHHASAISEVHAFNPTGLYPCDWNNINHSHIAYHIYSNDNDLVSKMGVFPEGKNVNVYHILSQKCDNFVAAHNRTYYAAERITMLCTSAEQENGRLERTALTTLHICFSWVIFFAVLPLQLLYRLFECIYHRISSLCYNETAENMETDHAELVGSRATRTQSSLSESAVEPQS